MKKLNLVGVCLILTICSKSQIYLADNGLTSSGTGGSTTVSLGGTLNNSATSVDFGSGNSSSNLLFKKGSSGYFFIGNDGKIGINNNSPASRLDIVSGSTSIPALTLTAASGQTGYLFNAIDASGNTMLGVKATDGTVYGQGTVNIDARGKTNNFGLIITNIGSGDAGIRLVAASNGGNVDFVNFNYLQSPTWRYTNKHAKWLVNGNGFDPTSLYSYTFEQSGQPDSVNLMLLKGEASQTGDMLRIQNSGGTSLFRIFSDGKGYFAGKVGIGTTNLGDTAYKLFVETGVRTRKVKVDQSSWPDYVFGKDYPLLSLHDLEKYIGANNHLPGLQSAEEVKKDGLNLGDNQSELLKKIEELTLYVIQGNKRAEEQGKAIQALLKTAETQQREIEVLKEKLNK